MLNISDFVVLNNRDGGVRLNGSAAIISGGIGVRYLSGFQYEEFDASGVVSTAINNYNATVVGESLSINLAAQIYGLPEFTVTTVSDFSPVLGRQDNLLTGSLRVVFADNGPTLTIDASNGDAASFTVNVIADDPSLSSTVDSTTYTVAWTTNNRYFMAFGS